MIVPHYWAKARLQHKADGRQITVYRWGWSDTSQDEAQSLADRRAAEAMERLISGDKLTRRERLAAYDIGEGVPIREEVISRHGEDVVITRNSYGSLCLNARRVFFADVDTAPRDRFSIFPLGCVALLVLAVVAGLVARSWLWGIGYVAAGGYLLEIVVNSLNDRHRAIAEPKARARAMAVFESFVLAHPAWRLRVYETPNGYRLLAMHDVFDPQGEAAAEALKVLSADGLFARLCKLQGCFRARVSPKFWRLGYKPSLSWPKDKWPFSEAVHQQRQRWVAEYDAQAQGYSSCRFVRELGYGLVHPEAEAVRLIHDELSRAETTLPCA